jgi:TonB family protein
VNAQSVTPASAASAPAKDAGPSERVQREASDVFRWIKVHTDKPRKVVEIKPASKPDVAAASTDNSAPAPAPAKGDKKTASAPASVTAPTPTAPPVELAVERPIATATSQATPVAVVASVPVAEAVVETVVPEPIEVEKPLQPIAQPEPKFPVDVVAELGKGSVTLRFMVQADGTVSEPEVLSSSHRRLNRPALEAVALWRFEPISEPRKTQVELVFNQDD